ncbi:MAG: hypothetical protein RBT63_11735, partial [Bdellovibrionales bacterium]|nr:hypothetical protein [Bdellovibrionales bacterium]
PCLASDRDEPIARRMMTRELDGSSCAERWARRDRKPGMGANASRITRSLRSRSFRTGWIYFASAEEIATNRSTQGVQ